MKKTITIYMDGIEGEVKKVHDSIKLDNKNTTVAASRTEDIYHTYIIEVCNPDGDFNIDKITVDDEVVYLSK